MRLISTSTGFFGVAALAALAITLPLSSSGCGRSACFVFSNDEFMHHGGCPTMKDALKSFTDTSCPGAVNAVNGEGTFTFNEENPAQSICCYSVTQQDIDPDFNSGECVPPGGGGGAGGDFGGSSGVGTVGVGGSFSGCVTCDNFLEGVSGDLNQACTSSVASALDALATCVCSSTGPCATLCDLNLCQEKAVSKDCLACVEDTAANGCDAELFECKTN